MDKKGKMDETELKPCPFCGGQMSPPVMCFRHPYDQPYLDWLKANKMLPAIATGFNRGFKARCYHCGAETGAGMTRREAAKKWNRRAQFASGGEDGK